MGSSSADDLYTDPASGVFHNKLRLTDPRQLAEAERRFSFARRIELVDAPVAQTFDMAHLRALHHHLFQDMYPWAGEVRKVEISKGQSQFHAASMMDTAAEHTFGKLAASGLISDMSLDDETFVRLAADVLADLNYMHPFREGNGRTQRAFLDDVAAVSRRVLAWRNVSAAENTRASELAHSTASGAPFIDMIRRACAPPLDGFGVLSPAA
ncbi:Fic family protein [Microbacterium sp. W1N]|uniref:Fic/DOC family protein n=1 Tax=Microbacterium festucae TaxID=2977531 RepID=UPI0021BFAED0|nr:Fic family protein [Microbacterium festucae]MCT9819304.1 Fic family protein [Microbacterium festucae]